MGKENFNDKIQDIEKIYDDFFISCKNLKCCGQNELKKKYTPNCYCYNRSLIITKNYFDKDDRILIIGQEKAEKRQDAIYEYTFEKEHFSDAKSHWFATLMTIIKFNNPNMDTEKLKQIEEEKDCKQYIDSSAFAFTNYYKCAFSKDGKWSGTHLYHSKEMKKCGVCLEKEIDYLRPTLIVKQGTWCGVNNFFCENYGNGKEIDHKEYVIKGEKRIFHYKVYLKEYLYKDTNKKFYIIEAYHPCLQNSYGWNRKNGCHKKHLYELIEKYYKSVKEK